MSRRRSLLAVAVAGAAAVAAARAALRRTDSLARPRAGGTGRAVPPLPVPVPTVVEESEADAVPEEVSDPEAEIDSVEEALAAELGDAAVGLQLDMLAAGSTDTTRIHRATRDADRAVLVEVRTEGSADMRSGTADQRLVSDLLASHPLVEIAVPVDLLCTAGVRTTLDPGGLTLEEARAAGASERREWAEALWRLAFGALRRHGLALSGLAPTLMRFLPEGRVAVVRLGGVEHVEPVAMGWYGELVRAAIDGDDRRLEAALADLAGAAPAGWHGPLKSGEVRALSLVDPAGPNLPAPAAPIDRLHRAMGRLLEELDALPPIAQVMAELWRGAAATTPHGEAEGAWWKSRETVSLLDPLGDRSR